MQQLMKLKLSQNFDAAHCIGSHKGKCKNVHGHTWTVNVELEFLVDIFFDGGILVDFGDIKSLINELDHKNLNEVFYREDVTAEFLTLHFIDKIKLLLVDKHYLHSIFVEVWESPTASVSVKDIITK